MGVLGFGGGPPPRAGVIITELFSWDGRNKVDSGSNLQDNLS